ncbi:MAG: GNAT family N-acetyltransferase [Bacteroidota bacterium]|nr:GNAT family N-acetyltransferase [Bacteroidota bacterium]
MQTIQLIPATTNDISTISSLAVEIWNDYYVPIIGQKQVDYMLNKMYSRDNMIEQIEIKKHIFFLIKNNLDTVGFISINNEKANDWFLNKFYIKQSIAAKGIGTEAFNLLTEKISAKKITLTVNRKNYKSINFYFKNSFKIKTVEDFDIGNGYFMNDFIMEWVA